MTLADNYLTKNDPLGNLKKICNGIYETQEQQLLEDLFARYNYPRKIRSSTMGAVVSIGLGLVASLYKKTYIGIGLALLAIPLSAYAAYYIRLRRRYSTHALAQTQQVYQALMDKIREINTDKEYAVRASLTGKLFTTQAALIKEMNENVKKYNDLSQPFLSKKYELRTANAQNNQHFQKIAATTKPNISASLYPYWLELQKACRSFLRTGLGSDIPFIDIEETDSEMWKVKPEPKENS
jgi:hypothetical protein